MGLNEMGAKTAPSTELSEGKGMNTGYTPYDDDASAFLETGYSMGETALGARLHRFGVLEGIELAAVVANDGLLIESMVQAEIDVDAICAVASNSLAMAESLGREIDKGQTLQVILEYGEGFVVIEPINREAMLLLVTSNQEQLGQVRFLIALHRDELLDALEAI